MTERSLFAERALLPDGWSRDVLIEIGADGGLAAVTPGALHDPKKLVKEITAKGLDYPSFVVDYKAGRERALAEFKKAGSS